MAIMGTEGAHLRMLMITQRVDLDDDVLGFTHGWVNKLAEVQQRGLADYFEFVGAVPHRQVASYYQQADVFVHMCASGGFDKASLEAMACGVPVVTCNEAFMGLLDGFSIELMYEVGDGVELADRLWDVLMLSSDERRRMGAELRDRVVSEHGLAGLVDRLVAVFEEVTR